VRRTLADRDGAMRSFVCDPMPILTSGLRSASDAPGIWNTPDGGGPVFTSCSRRTPTCRSARQGSIGDAGDQWAFATAWGFDVADVSQHVDIWQGDADTVAAPTGAHVLDGMLQDSTVHSLPGEGHFSIGLRMADVLAGR
jgi:hypothetical protein